jgi:hypothetical protein
VQAAEGYDERKHQLCTALRDEAMAIDSPSGLPLCAHFDAFTAHVGALPPKLTKPASELARLSGYLEAQVSRSSEESAWRAAEVRARRIAEREVDEGSAAAAARADAKVGAEAAFARSADTLSLSDHRPIWATVTLPTDSDGATATTVRVCSHNVQEMVRDGVSTYVWCVLHIGACACMHTRMEMPQLWNEAKRPAQRETLARRSRATTKPPTSPLVCSFRSSAVRCRAFAARKAPAALRS